MGGGWARGTVSDERWPGKRGNYYDSGRLIECDRIAFISIKKCESAGKEIRWLKN